MYQIKKWVLLGVLFGFSGTHSALAADLHESTLKLCERVKMCAYESISIDLENGNNQLMLEALIDGLCEQIATPLITAAKDGGHEVEAQLCLNDVLTLECPDLMSGQAKHLESCQNLKQLAEQAGATFN